MLCLFQPFVIPVSLLHIAPLTGIGCPESVYC